MLELLALFAVLVAIWLVFRTIKSTGRTLATIMHAHVEWLESGHQRGRPWWDGPLCILTAIVVLVAIVAVLVAVFLLTT